MEIVGHTDLGSTGFDQVQIRDAPMAQLTDRVIEEADGVGVCDAPVPAEGRKAHAKTFRSDDSPDRVDDLEQEPRPLGNRSAIRIGPMVAAVAQELIDQMSVRTLDLHAIESRSHRIPGCFRERVDETRDLRRVEGTGCFRLPWMKVGREQLSDVRDRGWRDGQRPAVVVSGQRTPAVVLQLQDDAAASGVNAFGDDSPGGDLPARVDARRRRIAVAVRADRGAFRDDQSRTGSLAVVVGHQLGGQAARCGSHAGEGRHDNAIRQVERTGRPRGEERRIGFHI